MSQVPENPKTRPEGFLLPQTQPEPKRVKPETNLNPTIRQPGNLATQQPHPIFLSEFIFFTNDF